MDLTLLVPLLSWIHYIYIDIYESGMKSLYDDFISAIDFLTYGILAMQHWWKKCEDFVKK